MAVTAKKNKVRLDFADAIEETVPAVNTEKGTEEVNNVEAPVEVKNNQEEEIKPVQEENTTPEVAEPIKEETTKVEEIQVNEETGEVIDDLDTLLNSMSQSSGKQKSVYLEYDNYAYIQEKCKKTNAKFSTVLNILLRKAIQEQKI